MLESRKDCGGGLSQGSKRNHKGFHRSTQIKMRYIDSWLSGLGLEYIIPKLKANGITTPKKLAMLSLRDMYEVGKSQTL